MSRIAREEPRHPVFQTIWWGNDLDRGQILIRHYCWLGKGLPERLRPLLNRWLQVPSGAEKKAGLTTIIADLNSGEKLWAQRVWGGSDNLRAALEPLETITRPLLAGTDNVNYQLACWDDQLHLDDTSGYCQQALREMLLTTGLEVLAGPEAGGEPETARSSFPLYLWAQSPGAGEEALSMSHLWGTEDQNPHLYSDWPANPLQWKGSFEQRFGAIDPRGGPHRYSLDSVLLDRFFGRIGLSREAAVIHCLSASSLSAIESPLGKWLLQEHSQGGFEWEKYRAYYFPTVPAVTMNPNFLRQRTCKRLLTAIPLDYNAKLTTTTTATTATTTAAPAAPGEPENTGAEERLPPLLGNMYLYLAIVQVNFQRSGRQYESLRLKDVFNVAPLNSKFVFARYQEGTESSYRKHQPSWQEGIFGPAELDRWVKGSEGAEKEGESGPTIVSKSETVPRESLVYYKVCANANETRRTFVGIHFYPDGRIEVRGHWSLADEVTLETLLADVRDLAVMVKALPQTGQRRIVPPAVDFLTAPTPQTVLVALNVSIAIEHKSYFPLAQGFNLPFLVRLSRLANTYLQHLHFCTYRKGAKPFDIVCDDYNPESMEVEFRYREVDFFPLEGISALDEDYAQLNRKTSKQVPKSVWKEALLVKYAKDNIQLADLERRYLPQAVLRYASGAQSPDLVVVKGAGLPGIDVNFRYDNTANIDQYRLDVLGIREIALLPYFLDFWNRFLHLYVVVGQQADWEEILKASESDNLQRLLTLIAPPIAAPVTEAAAPGAAGVGVGAGAAAPPKKAIDRRAIFSKTKAAVAPSTVVKAPEVPAVVGAAAATGAAAAMATPPAGAAPGTKGTAVGIISKKELEVLPAKTAVLTTIIDILQSVDNDIFGSAKKDAKGDTYSRKCQSGKQPIGMSLKIREANVTRIQKVLERTDLSKEQRDESRQLLAFFVPAGDNSLGLFYRSSTKIPFSFYTCPPAWCPTCQIGLAPWESTTAEGTRRCPQCSSTGLLASKPDNKFMGLADTFFCAPCCKGLLSTVQRERKKCAEKFRSGEHPGQSSLTEPTPATTTGPSVPGTPSAPGAAGSQPSAIGSREIANTYVLAYGKEIDPGRYKWPDLPDQGLNKIFNQTYTKGQTASVGGNLFLIKGSHADTPENAFLAVMGWLQGALSTPPREGSGRDYRQHLLENVFPPLQSELHGERERLIAFARYHQGILASVFHAVPVDTAETILEALANAYGHFRRFLQSEYVDEDFLWDVVSQPGVTVKEGFNLIIITKTSDWTSSEDQEIKCPLGYQLSHVYHPDRPLALIIKTQREKEPVPGYLPICRSRIQETVPKKIIDRPLIGLEERDKYPEAWKLLTTINEQCQAERGEDLTLDNLMLAMKDVEGVSVRLEGLLMNYYFQVRGAVLEVTPASKQIGAPFLVRFPLLPEALPNQAPPILNLTGPYKPGESEGTAAEVDVLMAALFEAGLNQCDPRERVLLLDPMRLWRSEEEGLSGEGAESGSAAAAELVVGYQLPGGLNLPFRSPVPLSSRSDYQGLTREIITEWPEEAVDLAVARQPIAAEEDTSRPQVILTNQILFENESYQRLRFDLSKYLAYKDQPLQETLQQMLREYQGKGSGRRKELPLLRQRLEELLRPVLEKLSGFFALSEEEYLHYQVPPLRYICSSDVGKTASDDDPHCGELQGRWVVKLPLLLSSGGTNQMDRYTTLIVEELLRSEFKREELLNDDVELYRPKYPVYHPGEQLFNEEDWLHNPEGVLHRDIAGGQIDYRSKYQGHVLINPPLLEENISFTAVKSPIYWHRLLGARFKVDEWPRKRNPERLYSQLVYLINIVTLAAIGVAPGGIPLSGVAQLNLEAFKNELIDSYETTRFNIIGFHFLPPLKDTPGSGYSATTRLTHLGEYYASTYLGRSWESVKVDITNGKHALNQFDLAFLSRRFGLHFLLLGERELYGLNTYSAPSEAPWVLLVDHQKTGATPAGEDLGSGEFVLHRNLQLLAQVHDGGTKYLFPTLPTALNNEDGWIRIQKTDIAPLGSDGAFDAAAAVFLNTPTDLPRPLWTWMRENHAYDEAAMSQSGFSLMPVTGRNNYLLYQLLTAVNSSTEVPAGIPNTPPPLAGIPFTAPKLIDRLATAIEGLPEIEGDSGWKVYSDIRQRRQLSSGRAETLPLLRAELLEESHIYDQADLWLWASTLGVTIVCIQEETPLPASAPLTSPPHLSGSEEEDEQEQEELAAEGQPIALSLEQGPGGEANAWTLFAYKPHDWPNFWRLLGYNGLWLFPRGHPLLGLFSAAKTVSNPVNRVVEELTQAKKTLTIRPKIIYKTPALPATTPSAELPPSSASTPSSVTAPTLRRPTVVITRSPVPVASVTTPAPTSTIVPSTPLIAAPSIPPVAVPLSTAISAAPSPSPQTVTSPAAAPLTAPKVVIIRRPPPGSLAPPAPTVPPS